MDLERKTGRFAVKYLAIEELVFWTYRDQRAHQFLRKDSEWFGFMVDTCEAAGSDAPRAKVHRDAAAVHAAVCSLGEIAALLVVMYAVRGERPDYSDIVPQPGPVFARDGDAFCWAKLGGRKVQVKKHVVERVETFSPVMRRFAGGGVVQTGEFVSSSFAIEACPIDWYPDAEMMAQANSIAYQWDKSLTAVTQELLDVPLREYRLSLPNIC